jgi:hypothetical protein
MTQGANGRSTGLRHVTDGGSDGGSPGERRAISPDDALPPVEPPSAGFIIKLFVVPALIVAAVVGVVMCFQWIARSEVDVGAYLSAIERNANNAWQCANDLAYLLHQDEKLRVDEPTATRLSNMTVARLKSGPPKGINLSTKNISEREREQLKEQVLQEIGVRVFLCKALGEFATPAALPGLIEAARNDESRRQVAQAADSEIAAAIEKGDWEVRKAALEALALLAYNVRQQGQSIATPEVVSLVLAASREVGPAQQRAIRERAAYALGVFGGEQATGRLVEMLSDLYGNVRFNAATGLARQGNAKGMDVLREMIDPTESVAADLQAEEGIVLGNVSDADKAALRAEMEAMIRFSGLSAAEQLANKANASADLSKIVGAIDSLLAQSELHPRVRAKAEEVRNLLKTRAE